MTHHGDHTRAEADAEAQKDAWRWARARLLSQFLVIPFPESPNNRTAKGGAAGGCAKIEGSESNPQGTFATSGS